MNYLSNQNWTFPVPISYGPGRIKEISKICINNKIKNPLIVTDKGSSTLGFIASIQNNLHKEGLKSDLFFEISPNPKDTEVLAGKKKYVKNIYLQNLGIGRGMKVGKEAIYAAIIGVENWYKRNWKKEINNQNKILQVWLTFLAKEKFKGITYEIIADPTGNKINRLRVHVDSKISKFTIQSLSYYLEKKNPAIFVRDDLIHLNHFELDTCNLKKGQEKVVMNELKKTILKLLKFFIFFTNNILY